MEPEAPRPQPPFEETLLETNISLWREISDEVFERHFRRRYFGEEPLSRHQAIVRLAGELERLQAKRAVAPFQPVAEHGTSAALSCLGAGVPREFFPALLPARRFPWLSLLLSLAGHSLFVLLLLLVRLPERKIRLIDFETEDITYYQISQALPDISPAPAPLPAASLHLTSPAPALPGAEAGFETQAAQSVQIRPEARKRVEIVIEQPGVKDVSVLPRLTLPNILMQTSKLEPGVGPITVTPRVDRDLHKQPSFLNSLEANVEPALAEPLPLPATPEVAGARRSALNLSTYSESKLSLALPVEPPRVTPHLSQLPSRPQMVGVALAPLVAPPVDDSKVGFEVQQLPQSRGANLFVYSVDPAIPRGQLAVPKVNSPGTIRASPQQAMVRALPAGVSEISSAEVVLPSVSIRSRTPLTIPGAGMAVVQAPSPKPPAEEPQESKEKPASLLDLLPSRIPSRKAPSAVELKSSVPAESPLQEYEQRGGPVYTAAINAPNFTSKRGSWIFRFAELPGNAGDIEPIEGNGAAASSPPTLTAPSATVKVDPKYPPEVVRDKVEGVVVLFAILRKDGIVDPESVRVVRKLDPRLDASARDALLRWRFKPSLKNGVPVDIQTEITIPFYFRREEP